MRVFVLAALLVCLAVPASAQKYLGCAGGATCDLSQGLTPTLSFIDTPIQLNFVLASPTVAAFKAPARIHRALSPPLPGLGAHLFTCVARGGDYGTSLLIVRARECTSPGAQSCAPITGDLTIMNANTEFTTAYTDTAWAAGSYLEIEVTQDSTTPPAWLSCMIVGF